VCTRVYKYDCVYVLVVVCIVPSILSIWLM
jgi:hypothetical protein